MKNQHASELAKLGRGKKRRISRKERKRRSEQMKAINEKRK